MRCVCALLISDCLGVCVYTVAFYIFLCVHVNGMYLLKEMGCSLESEGFLSSEMRSEASSGNLAGLLVMSEYLPVFQLRLNGFLCPFIMSKHTSIIGHYADNHV